jgi:hypothetical protein
MRVLLAMSSLILLASTAFGQDFEIYVSDAGNFSNPPWQILKYDQKGENPEVFIDTNLAWPQDIVFLEEAGTVLISNLNSGTITRHNAETGAYIDNFATGIGGPTRMKIGADNLLYVLQWTGNGKVRRYQLDGAFVDEFTSEGVPQSIGLDWDSAGNLYVSSYNGDSVRKFGPTGADLGFFINSNLAGPTNIWFDGNGDLLVSDYDGTAVKRFGPAGNYLGEFMQGLSNSEGVALLPGGDILIGNGATGSVKRFSSSGAFIEDFVTANAGGLIRPNAVVLRNLETGRDVAINQGMIDAWYDPDTNGQGFFITVFPVIKQVFLAWFTYDTERPPEDVTAILGEPGHRWVTAQGSYDGNTANLTVFVSEGGVFDSPTPAATTDPAGDGTITLTFADCTSGTLDYEITSLNLQGQIPIQRIVLDRVALCETLAGL